MAEPEVLSISSDESSSELDSVQVVGVLDEDGDENEDEIEETSSDDDDDDDSSSAFSSNGVEELFRLAYKQSHTKSSASMPRNYGKRSVGSKSRNNLEIILSSDDEEKKDDVSSQNEDNYLLHPRADTSAGVSRYATTKEEASCIDLTFLSSTDTGDDHSTDDDEYSKALYQPKKQATFHASVESCIDSSNVRPEFISSCGVEYSKVRENVSKQKATMTAAHTSSSRLSPLQCYPTSDTAAFAKSSWAGEPEESTSLLGRGKRKMKANPIYSSGSLEDDRKPAAKRMLGASLLSSELSFTNSYSRRYLNQLYKAVETAIRTSRRTRKTHKDNIFSSLIQKKNEFYAMKEQSTTEPQIHRLLPLHKGELHLPSNYMDEPDFPLPSDSNHTVYISKNFSSRAALVGTDLDNDQEEAPPSPLMGGGSSDDENQNNVNYARKIVRTPHDLDIRASVEARIEEFRQTGVGAGYEKDELNDDIDYVLNTLDFKTSQDREISIEYLSLMLEIEPGLIRERLKNLTGTAVCEKKARADAFDKHASSFRDLFCRRCNDFDCIIHGNSGAQYPSDIQLELCMKLKDERMKKKEPQGNVVLKMLIDEERRSLSKRQRVKEIPLEKPVREISAKEVALCQRLYKHFRGDTTTVSKLTRIAKSTIDDMDLQPFEYIHLKNTKGMVDISSKQKRVVPPCFRLKEGVEHPYDFPFFDPCSHAGPCDKDTCSCIKEGFYCTKACLWGMFSKNFWRGCQCKAGCRKACPCRIANRECDPNLCKNCHACSDPMNQKATLQSCRNDNITMRRHAHLLMGKSELPNAGWGCFTKYALKKDDYIHEYIGEIITDHEAELRGKKCDEKKRTYLFNLSRDYAVDAQRLGNKTRFINHSQKPNVAALRSVVNGDLRIHFYALNDIPAQTELFFNYGSEFLSNTLK